MHRLSLFIVVLVLLTEGSSAFSQTNPPVSIGKQPGSADVPARPTLKRLTASVIPLTTRGVNQQLLEKENPNQQESAGDSLINNKPIRTEFEGLRAFSDVDMVRALNERGIVFTRTPMPSSESLTKAIGLIKELLEARGYSHAAVETRNDEEAGTIVFLVDEGQRLQLADVRFEGNRSFSSNELVLKMGECLAHYEKMQDGYDANIFDFCSRRLLNFMRSRGHLQATFGKTKKEIEAGGLVLSVPVHEGLLYRLGEIKIEGAEAVASEKVRAMLHLRQGDIAEGELIGQWLFEDLKRVYGEIGHIEYAAEPEPEFRAANVENEGVVDFKVTIEEGREFRVHSIKFQGSSFLDKELLGLLRPRVGDVFNQRLFEESIDQLNNSGRFEPIDKDRDADFRTDEEEALIDIVIKVNPKDGGPGGRKSPLTRRQP